MRSGSDVTRAPEFNQRKRVERVQRAEEGGAAVHARVQRAADLRASARRVNESGNTQEKSLE